MSSDAANARHQQHSAHSAVDAARGRLQDALAELETSLESKLAEASQRIARLQESLNTASSNDQSAAADQWQNACRLLEEQMAKLRDENSNLNSEVHRLRSENASLKETSAEAGKALDAAIHDIQTLLKD